MTAFRFRSLPVAALIAAGVAVPPLMAPVALASQHELLAQAKAAHDDHDPATAAKVAAAGVLDQATVNALRAAPLPKQVDAKATALLDRLASSAQIQRALAVIKADEPRFVQEAIQLSEIPAPTFEEAKRAQAYAALLKANGLNTVHIDSINNVIGVRKGSANGPKIAILAHLDTVFDAKTDVKVKKKGDVLFGPGLTDDSAALASMLSWLRAMNQANISTPGDLYFVGTVGEEAAGDLRGAKQFFRDHTDMAGAVILEPAPPNVAAIAQNATIRLEVSFKGPGGHAFAAYGQVPSAVHAMGRLIAKMSDMPIPTTPRTSFTVGTANGGDYVSKIAPTASMKLEIRSLSRQNVESLAKQVEIYAKQAVDEENKRWGVKTLSMSIKEFATRLGGMTPPDHPVVMGWMAAANKQGVKPFALAVASTDAAVPLSQGIPTLALGFGGVTGGFHALDENWNPTNAYRGVQISFLTTLAMAGVDGVTSPLVTKR